MKTFRQFMAEDAREAYRISVLGKDAKHHSIKAGEAQKELDRLDAKAGDKARVPGTRRHNLHMQVQNHKKKQKDLGG